MTQHKALAQPLTDAERLRWEGHKVEFHQFGRGFMRVTMALADAKRNELYREEYGPGEEGWAKFMRYSGFFDPKDWDRRRKSDFKRDVETLDDLSARVDTNLLRRLKNKTLRVLRKIIDNPIWQADLLNFIFRKGVQPEDVTEREIDRHWPHFRQEKEAEDKARKAELQLGYNGQDENEEQEEEAEPEKETPQEKAVIELAKQTQKQSDCPGRFDEQARLTCKNGNGIKPADLEIPGMPELLSQRCDQLERTVARVRSLIGKKGGSAA